MVAENGQVIKESDHSSDGWKSLIVNGANTMSLDIVVQISNFQQAKGGEKEPICIGKSAILFRDRELNMV
ncbi:MAG: hypothetical protein ACI93L_002012 [Cyclobacteriaceae bacterium]